MLRLKPFLSRLFDQRLSIRNTRFVLLNSRRIWLEICLIGFLIAVGIAIWPTASCSAFQSCGPRNTWCNGDCSQVCDGSTAFGYVSSCSRVGAACTENFLADVVDAQCSNAANCAISWVSSQSGRLSSGGTRWNAGACTFANNCTVPVSNVGPVDCCGAKSSSGSGGCTAEYDPPAIALGATTPRYPLVYGQDPDKLGITATINVTGGGKNNGCSEGDDQQTITSITLNSVSLSSASVNWITTTLSLRYPGAVVKGSYPLRPTPTTTGIGSTSAGLSFHFDPLDPGNYDISVTAIQGDGQSKTVSLSVPAYLLDSTITLPGQ